MPLLAPLVDRAKAARAAVGSRGYVGPNGLGCTDLAAHLANPTVNKTQRRHVGIEGTTLLFAAHYKPTTKKAEKDKYLFKHLHLDTLGNMMDSKSSMSLPNYSLTSHVPFVNRPFESEIHGPVNFRTFCCVLLVTRCHRVRFSCYVHPT